MKVKTSKEFDIAYAEVLSAETYKNAEQIRNNILLLNQLKNVRHNLVVLNVLKENLMTFKDSRTQDTTFFIKETNTLISDINKYTRKMQESSDE